MAFYTHEMAKKQIVNSFPCEITSVKAGGMENVALIVPKDSEYVELINH